MGDPILFSRDVDYSLPNYNQGLQPYWKQIQLSSKISSSFTQDTERELNGFEYAMRIRVRTIEQKPAIIIMHDRDKI